jgi:ribosomal protein S18 acetylase RimI-like enzyme
MGAVMQEALTANNRDDVFAFVQQQSAVHPHEPHWYLPLIGVDPAYRGRGIGSSLLRRALHTCDEQRLPAYLEATSPLNKALYGRHGFEVVGEIQAGASPPMWPMLRKPR